MPRPASMRRAGCWRRSRHRRSALERDSLSCAAALDAAAATEAACAASSDDSRWPISCPALTSLPSSTNRLSRRACTRGVMTTSLASITPMSTRSRCRLAVTTRAMTATPTIANRPTIVLLDFMRDCAGIAAEEVRIVRVAPARAARRERAMSICEVRMAVAPVALRIARRDAENAPLAALGVTGLEVVRFCASPRETQRPARAQRRSTTRTAWA